MQKKRGGANSKDIEAIDEELKELALRRKSILPGLEKMSQMARAGRCVRLPLLGREIPLVADEWAKPNLGSGCVKITPAHDPNDYQVGLRQSLELINILNSDGTLNAQAGPYQGLTIREARKKVVADLDRDQLLERVEDRQIDLAHSDRSKTPIEPYLADQWFISMNELAQSSMDAVRDGRVRITPTRYEKGYLDWLSEKRDWPVSRQLWWGHRIPVWSLTLTENTQLDQLQTTLNNSDAAKEDKLYLIMAEQEITSGNPQSTLHVCLRDDDPAINLWLEDLGFEQDPDVLDTWSVVPYGLIRHWVGRRRLRSWTIFIPPMFW